LILVDANILVYARVASFPQHRPARDWLDRQLSGIHRVRLPWASLLAFSPRETHGDFVISPGWPGKTR